MEAVGIALVSLLLIAIVGALYLRLDRRWQRTRRQTRPQPLPVKIPPAVEEALKWIVRQKWPRGWKGAEDGALRLRHNGLVYSPLGWQVSQLGREIPLPSPDVIADMALGLSTEAALLISEASESWVPSGEPVIRVRRQLVAALYRHRRA